jgi:hypothetical protein
VSMSQAAKLQTHRYFELTVKSLAIMFVL